MAKTWITVQLLKDSTTIIYQPCFCSSSWRENKARNSVSLLLQHLLLMMPLISLLPQATVLLTVQRSIIQSLLKTGLPSNCVDFWLNYCAHTLIKIRDTGKHFCCVVGRNPLILCHYYYFFPVNKRHYCPPHYFMTNKKGPLCLLYGNEQNL